MRRSAIDEIVQMVRTARPDVAHRRRALAMPAHARHLYTIGVTDAVPETIEASLQLSGGGAGGPQVCRRGR